MRGFFLFPLLGSVCDLCMHPSFLASCWAHPAQGTRKDQKVEEKKIQSGILSTSLLSPTPTPTHIPALTLCPSAVWQGLWLLQGGPASVALSPLSLPQVLILEFKCLVHFSKSTHTSEHKLSSVNLLSEPSVFCQAPDW